MRLIESIKLINGTAINLDYHQRRANRELLLPDVPPEYQTGVVKWRIVYEENTFEHSFTKYTLPSISSLKITYCDEIEYNHKYENRSSINRLFAERGSFDDILIVKNGHITDTSFCNVVFEKQNRLYTPSTYLLRGTKREYLLDTGIISQKEITLHDIWSYDKILLINAMIELGVVAIAINKKTKYTITKRVTQLTTSTELYIRHYSRMLVEMPQRISELISTKEELQ